MLNRNILSELNEWKANVERKPLILRGARQVGKTTIVDIFSNSYKQYIKLNLELSEDATPFRKYKNIRQLAEQLFFLYDKNIEEPQRSSQFR